ncbi:MAG: glycosyltransferase involved in cell wall biosynthesis [Planctomycetota bacterium]
MHEILRTLNRQVRVEPEPVRANDLEASVPVSVIVTACADSDALRTTLREVTRQARAAGGDCCLVVNTARDAMSASSRDALGCLVDSLIFEEKPGKSNALNAAIAEVPGRVVAFTDDDASPSASWLQHLLAAFDVSEGPADAPVVGVGGPVLPVLPRETTPGWYRRFLGRVPTSFLGPKQHLGNQSKDYELAPGSDLGSVPLGANCAWLRSSLLQYPYRPELGPNRDTGMRGGEDTCLALQVMSAGGRVRYEPMARVYHPVDPRRMTRDYALEGHRINAIEYVHLLSILGWNLPTRGELEQEIEKAQLGVLNRLLGGADWILRKRMRCKFFQTVLAEAHGG